MLEERLTTLLDGGAGLTANAVAVTVSAGAAALTRCTGQIAGRAVDEDTPFYGASLTKQLIGVLTAIAVERGELAYETAIREILPELPAWSTAIRVRHLLHHTSGVPETTSDDRRPEDNREVVDRLVTSAAPTTRPGVRYAYSNTGYVVLSEVLVAVAGHAIGDLLRQRVLAPAGLADSRVGTTVWSSPAWPDPPRTIGDGGWWPTVAELAAWLDALNQRVFGRGVAELTERPGRLDDATPLDYAWGVRIVPTTTGRLISHGGSWPGWLTKTVRIPERAVAVAVLTQGCSDEQAVSDLGIRLATSAADQTADRV